jgi:hypothetical protein
MSEVMELVAPLQGCNRLGGTYETGWYSDFAGPHSPSYSMPLRATAMGAQTAFPAVAMRFGQVAPDVDAVGVFYLPNIRKFDISEPISVEADIIVNRDAATDSNRQFDATILYTLKEVGRVSYGGKPSQLGYFHAFPTRELITTGLVYRRFATYRRVFPTKFVIPPNTIKSENSALILAMSIQTEGGDTALIDKLEIPCLLLCGQPSRRPR